MQNKNEVVIEKRNYTIFGISIWRLCTYFIMYSFIGYIIETLFGIATKGVWESRQSFLYGPFLGIYGVGAICIIFLSKYLNKNVFVLFVGGCLLGALIEYLTSFLAEVIVQTTWWDYSNNILNINGRICLLYSFFWGLLTIFVIKFLNPKLDKLIDKIKNKISSKLLKVFVLIITIFLFVNFLFTGFAQDLFITRTVVINDIQIRDYNRRLNRYEKLENTKWLFDFLNTIWSDKKMIKTFPNMKILDKNRDVIHMDSLFPDIQPYYIKIFDK